MSEKIDKVFSILQNYNIRHDFWHRHQVKHILSRIDDADIIEQIGMAELPQIINLLYYKYGGKYRLIDIGGDCMFRFGETNVANVSYLATYIHFLNITNGTLTIEGNVSLPSVLEKHFRFWISVNGQKHECCMYDAGFDKKIKKEIYETRTAFKLEQKLDKNAGEYKITFIYDCDGIDCTSGKINSMRFSPVADVIEGQYAIQNNWGIQIDKNSLIIKPEKVKGRLDYENSYQSTIKDCLVKELRNKYFDIVEKKERPIWLFMDRIDKADDNGEAFFRYVISQKPDADCYFVISKESPDYAKLSKLGKVIDAMSDEHRLLLLLADYIFTSQLNGWVENPFGDKEEYFRDLYHHAKVVFLQHGVTKDNQTKWLNRFNQNLYAIVTSSDIEKKAFLVNQYHYKEEQIWNVGMPRLDLLYSAKPKYILFMPTWRQAVMEQRIDVESGTYKWYPKNEFTESNYCKCYSAVLSDKHFIRECEAKGYTIVFMPHPIVQPYIDKFNILPSVKVFDYETNWRELFAESYIMITDYSSVAFDFAYLKKPIIYFQFDRKEFFESHTYKQGYFDYKSMGFGKVVKCKKQLIKEIRACMDNGFSMDEKYQIRVEKFYTFMDKECCRRLYEKL